MESMLAAIPTRSERQAMEWSLVLVSQGIEATIDRNPEENTWCLLVDGPDHPRALQALSQYRAENAGRAWVKPLPWTGLLLDWRSIAPLLFLVLVFAVEATGHRDLSPAGMMDNRAVHAGQWWRLFTAVLLHHDLVHLMANVSTGLLLLGLAMGAYGPGVGLLASFLAGAGGNVAGLLLYPERHTGLGASGMIMGALGLLAAEWISLLRHGLTPRQLALRGVLSGCLLLVLVGFSPEPNVDVIAHVGGFVSGLALGAACALCPRALIRNARTDLGALAACAGLIGWTSYLALRAG